MHPINQTITHIRLFGFKYKTLWAFGLFILFLLMFDGVLMYLVPLLVTQQGLSKTSLGLIVASSSLVGALFDIVLAKIVSRTQFRRMLLMVLIVAFLYGIVLYSAHTILVFLLAMALWGVWFDLLSFGTYNFIGRFIPASEHASSFAVLDIFRSLAYLLAPLVAGIIVVDRVTSQPFVVGFIFFIVAIALYFVLVGITARKAIVFEHEHIPKRKLPELRVIQQVIRHIWPVLLVVIFMGIFDSFYFTIGPLISEELSGGNSMSELFIPLYFLPLLITGWFVGSITKRFGKKRTAFVSIFLGSIPLLLYPLAGSVPLLLLFVLISSALNSVAWPATKGAIADYINESNLVEKEIEAVTDFSWNMGFVLGPVFAGVAADKIGNLESFSVLGLLTMVVILILMKITPRHIHVPNKV